MSEADLSNALAFNRLSRACRNHIDRRTELVEQKNIYEICTGERPEDMPLDELKKRNKIMQAVLPMEGKESAKELADRAIEEDWSMEQIETIISVVLR